MKLTQLLFGLIVACGFSSCATKIQTSPVPSAGTPGAPMLLTGPVLVNPAAAPVKRPATTKPTAAPVVNPQGALKQVPNPPQPRAFPNIPLKEPSDSSPLIHNKPDQPVYQRSR